MSAVLAVVPTKLPRYYVNDHSLPDGTSIVYGVDFEAGIMFSVAPSRGGELSSYKVISVSVCVMIWGRTCACGFRVSQVVGPGGNWLELLHHGDNYAAPLVAGGWQGRGAHRKLVLTGCSSSQRTSRVLPAVLSPAAPNLFPAVGRNFTADQVSAAAAVGAAPPTCRYTWNAVTRDIGVHGFAKDVEYEVRICT